MKAGPFSLVLGILCLALIAAAQPGLAGGAWPRGKDKGFLSLSYSTFGDVMGYMQSLSYQVPGVEPVELTQEIAAYFEYGITENLTFGIDRIQRPHEHSFSTVYFLRRNYSRPNWRSSYGFEVGMGGYRDWRQINDTQFRVGASWGRGFETRWIDGWVDIDAKMSGLDKARTMAWKVDSTLGLKPGERSLFYLQMQSGALDGYPTYTRAQPTYVMKLGRGISIESAVTIGLENDESQGMKIGAWLDF
ncbi:hypothetical protein R3X27_06440 [Tropicimonas sp. TH_r6]|uniref:hypothetical protein n=1 Tax=Tropicimonas sp. TH_r6 TaxID=3082085 RepID=UPI0029547C2B|nr:hypothetical protein [Tropicimonas sp. TH_r6]MDV7142315.1 hypothetical protein [Tropicimonas sp. TH_r6]